MTAEAEIARGILVDADGTLVRASFQVTDGAIPLGPGRANLQTGRGFCQDSANS